MSSPLPTINFKRTLANGITPLIIEPVSIISPWIDLVTDPTVTDTPAVPSGITRVGQNLLDNGGQGTTALIRCKYPAGLTGITNPIVCAVGLDENNVPAFLLNAAGDKEFTLTITPASDVQDSDGMHYTPWVEIDMQACRWMLVPVKTALAATGSLENATIQVKVK